jgi:CHAD domain-containing protein
VVHNVEVAHGILPSNRHMTPASEPATAPASATSVFVPGPGRLQARDVTSALVGAGFELAPFRGVHRTLLDTFDGRLHAAGIRLEVRVGAGMELVVSDAGPAPARVPVEEVPRLVDSLPAGPMRARLGPVLDVRALLPVLGVAAQVATAVRRNSEGKAEVTLTVHDQLKLVSGNVISAPWAVEVAPLEGYPKAARQARALLRSLGLIEANGSVLDLAAAAAGMDLRGFVDSPTVALDPSEPALDGFRRVLVNLAATMDANWQGTVDAIDPEFLHDLRVAVRRTRSLLAHGKQVLPVEGRDHFGAEFRWLGTVTGPARDMDVYLIEWPTYVGPLDAASSDALAPVVEHLSRRRTKEHATLARELASPRYKGLMTAWGAWLEGPFPETALPKKATVALGGVVAARLTQAQDRLLTRGRAIGPATPAEELHELRKDAKRLRYLLECFGGMLPPSVRKPFVQRLKALQDNLGEHQDTEVHTAQLQEMAHELHGAPGVTADTLVAIGRLTDAFDRRRIAARQEFAERFSAYDTKQTARALAALLKAAQPR